MAHSLLTRLVSWAFERFYHEGAWTYDTVAWLVSRGYWSAWIAVVLPELHDEPVLELGCGTGYLQRGRLHSPQLTIGLDESASMLARARDKLRRAGAEGRLVRAVAQRLPFGDRSWPNVVATFPAPYLFDPATLAEIGRVMAPGGRLLIVDGGVLPAGPYQRVIAAIYRWVLGAESGAADPVGNAGDRRVERLEQLGFAVRSEWRTVGRSQVQVLTCGVADGWHR